MRCEATSEGKNISVDSVAISKNLKANNSRPLALDPSVGILVNEELRQKFS